MYVYSSSMCVYCTSFFLWSSLSSNLFLLRLNVSFVLYLDVSCGYTIFLKLDIKDNKPFKYYEPSYDTYSLKHLYFLLLQGFLHWLWERQERGEEKRLEEARVSLRQRHLGSAHPVHCFHWRGMAPVSVWLESLTTLMLDEEIQKVSFSIPRGLISCFITAF